MHSACENPYGYDEPVSGALYEDVGFANADSRFPLVARINPHGCAD
jgi:hypothetical protein